MVNLSKLLLTALFCMGGSLLFAQTTPDPLVFKNAKGKIYFARLRPDQAKPLKEAPGFLRSFLEAGPGYEFKLRREHTDANGTTHQRYDQYFQGVKIEGAEYLVHSKNGLIQSINGGFDNVSVASTTPAITPAQAISNALAAVPATKYGWQEAFTEARYKQLSNDPAATLYPSPQLVIAFDNNITLTHRLAYKVHVYAVQPFSDYNVYVDAATGKVIGKVNLVCTVNTPGTGVTLYSGQQNITVDSWTGGFRLLETRNGPAGSAQIHTLNMQNGSIYNNAVEFTNPTPNFTQDGGLDAHWGAEMVFDFFNQVFGRNSWNGAGGEVRNYVHANLPAIDPRLTNDNAFWDGSLQQMTYGDGATAFRSVTALDVIAHEIGHGVRQAELGLGGANDAAALNEGLSDIWGACISHWAAPQKNAWLIGEEIMNNGFPCLRSLSNPNDGWPGGSGTGNYADTYQAGNWSNDYSRNAYTNATVLGRWFNLLSVGGSGTNGKNNSYNVTGITIEQAQRIVYRMETEWLSADATFPGAREASINAVRDLYGAYSCQEEAVVNAWYAVGVGDKYTLVRNLAMSGPTTLCNGGSATYTLSNVPAGASISWQTTNSSTSITPAADGLSAVVTYNGSGGSNTSVVAQYPACSGPVQASVNVGLGQPSTIGIVSYSNAVYCDFNTFNFKIGGPTGYTYGMTIQIGATGATSYRWSQVTSSNGFHYDDLGNGRASIGSKVTNGSITLKATATNSCGSTSSNYTFIGPGISCPVFRLNTQDADRINANDRMLQVYPNPVTDQVTITLPNELVTGDATIRITDVYGRQVQRLTNVAATTTVSMSGLSAGVYIVEVYSKNTTKLTKKITKQ